METLLEYNVLVQWMAGLQNALVNTDRALAQPKNGQSIPMLNQKRKLEADIKACAKVQTKLQDKVKKHFEEKYSLKLEMIK